MLLVVIFILVFMVLTLAFARDSVVGFELIAVSSSTRFSTKLWLRLAVSRLSAIGEGSVGMFITMIADRNIYSDRRHS